MGGLSAFISGVAGSGQVGLERPLHVYLEGCGCGGSMDVEWTCSGVWRRKHRLSLAPPWVALCILPFCWGVEDRPNKPLPHRSSRPQRRQQAPKRRWRETLQSSMLATCLEMFVKRKWMTFSIAMGAYAASTSSQASGTACLPTASWSLKMLVMPLQL